MILHSIYSHFIFFTSSFYFFLCYFSPFNFPSLLSSRLTQPLLFKIPHTYTLSLSLFLFPNSTSFFAPLKTRVRASPAFQIVPSVAYKRENCERRRNTGSQKSKVNATAVSESRRRRNSRVEYRWECANFRKELVTPLRFLRDRIIKRTKITSKIIRFGRKINKFF